jgi:hypothetical protein
VPAEVAGPIFSSLGELHESTESIVLSNDIDKQVFVDKNGLALAITEVDALIVLE